LYNRPDKKEGDKTVEYKINYSNGDQYIGEIDTDSNLKEGWGEYFYANGER